MGTVDYSVRIYGMTKVSECIVWCLENIGGHGKEWNLDEPETRGGYIYSIFVFNEADDYAMFVLRWI